MTSHYRFRVHLMHVDNPPWRQFLVPVDASFEDLHRAIQCSCSWEESHSFQFRMSGEQAGILGKTSPNEDDPDYAQVALASWFGLDAGSHRSCSYIYDFGDYWQHEVFLEALATHGQSNGCSLLAGQLAFPPEDCGGLPGFKRSRSIRAKSKGWPPKQVDPEFERWPGAWQPHDFDLKSANAQLANLVTHSVNPSSAGELHLLPSSEPKRSETNPADQPSPALIKQTQRLACLIMAATLQPAGSQQIAPIRCNRRPSHSACKGYITTLHLIASDDIHWNCPVCADHGVISHWINGRFDLTPFLRKREKAKSEMEIVKVPAKAHAALVREFELCLDHAPLLLSGSGQGETVILRGEIGEFEYLLDDCLTEADITPSRAFRKQLHLLCDAIEFGSPWLNPNLVEMSASTDNRATVIKAIEGLGLDSNEVNGLTELLRESRAMLSHGPPEIEKRILETIREVGESMVLRREIAACLAVESVDFKHLHIFLTSLQHTFARLEEFGNHAPQIGLGLMQSLLEGIAKIADRIHASENELEEINTLISDVALRQASACAQPSDQRRSQLTLLLDLWDADTCSAFSFVPRWIGDQKLGKRDCKWLRVELEKRLQVCNQSGKVDLRVLIERYS